MTQKAYSLSHTKWMCKYHIVFTPKYRRKVIYNKLRKDIGVILKRLCSYKGREIIEEHLMPDHVHMLVVPLIFFGGGEYILRVNHPLCGWRCCLLFRINRTNGECGFGQQFADFFLSVCFYILCSNILSRCEVLYSSCQSAFF